MSAEPYGRYTLFLAKTGRITAADLEPRRDRHKGDLDPPDQHTAPTMMEERIEASKKREGRLKLGHRGQSNKNHNRGGRRWQMWISAS